MIMPPRLRKITLIAHIVSSVGSLGAVAGFLALAIAGLFTESDQVMRSVYIVTELVARSVIVPLVFASLVTGLVQSLGTTWGLFRHYWVLAKLLLTIFTAVVLMLQMSGIAHVAAVAADPGFASTDVLGLGRSLVVHAAGGLVVLLVTTTLSVLKPRGLTRYGWRRLHRQ
jgi:ABC-type anion transport system duplicated permease subunit